MNQAAGNAPSEPAPAASGSNLRETVETIVFVVVLVLLLKTFVAEAFVIPTGSMATTLYGDQKLVVCPQCELEFPVNCSSERESQERGGSLDAVIGCTCPNCRYRIDFVQDSMQPSCRTGDRVVVSKFAYDTPLGQPEREDVVVFKFPKTPQKDWAALNYIKRLVGLPGETIAIQYGDLYVYPDPHDKQAAPLTYLDRPRPQDPEELWRDEYTYVRDPEAVALFHAGKFQIVRKPAAQVLTLRRIVYDNDHQPKDLQAAGFPPRWAPEKEAGPATADYQALRRQGQEETAWTEDAGHGFRHARESGGLSWLRYRHLAVDRSRETRTDLAALRDVKPALITDFLGYNTYQTHWGRHGSSLPANWVGDLLLDCTVKLDSTSPEPAAAQLTLELARGVNRLQARWDLHTGICTLVRLNAEQEDVLASQATSLKAKGTYEVRFGNFDERLLIWLDGKLIFGDGAVYSSPRQRGPTANDLRPAGIAAAGAVLAVSQLKLWRDTYYTTRADDSDARSGDWTDPRAWDNLRDLPVMTYYVQPGHFLCFGDNSPQSLDSRYWGSVPRRLMLGRALLVYYPLSRIRPIR